VKTGDAPLFFRVFDPDACQFPSPRVPILPSLGIASFGFGRSRKFASVFSAAPNLFYSRGRYALHDAYRLSGVGPKGALLAPAYHCRTMLDPAICLGGTVILYPLEAKLAPDIALLAQLVDSSEMPVRAMLLTHYFGFAQATDAVQAFCDERDIVLVEDCSHACFRSFQNTSLGQSGRFVVTSPYKLFPSEDGGGLQINGKGSAFPSRLRARGSRDEMRSLVNSFRRAIRSRPQTGDAGTDEQLRHICAKEIVKGREFEQPGNQVSSMYDPLAENLAGLSASRLIISFSNVDRIAEARRNNYRQWLDAVRFLPHCRPLFDELPDDVVPYMFPLYVEYPTPHFFVLKQLGLPIWRWDEMAVSNCVLAMDYRLHLLHLPCHQSLSRAEMRWMTQTLAGVMTEIPVP
jgi:dTDP-4-amino-4,6-dideoxygalactose transaminase